MEYVNAYVKLKAQMQQHVVYHFSDGMYDKNLSSLSLVLLQITYEIILNP